MIVQLDALKNDSLKPSVYAEMIWEQKKERAMRNGQSIDWIIMRNRLSNIQAKNKLEMEKILLLLSKRLGFRMASGFGERVIFRELFLKGLTLLDLEDTGQKLSLSHISAKQELRNLIDIMQLPVTVEKIEKRA
jgi:chromosome partitioning protein